MPPLFSYEEGGDRLSFWSPRTVRLIRRVDGDTRVCRTELPDEGNMWSGRDVENAFRNADVKSALRRTKAPYSADRSAVVVAGDAKIVWAIERDKCLPQPPGLEHLLTVLRTVMLNRRSLCP